MKKLNSKSSTKTNNFIDDFFKSANKTGSWILQNFKWPIVAHHYDADGIAAGSIVSIALSRNNIVHTTIMKSKFDLNACTDLKNLALSENQPREIILTDFGSGQIEFVKSELIDAGLKVAILDHHVPSQKQFEIDSKLFSQTNCCLNGFDGGISASAATTCFCAFNSMSEDSSLISTNIDLIPIALAGAVGDMQDLSGSFKDINLKVLELAINSNKIKLTNDLRIAGKSQDIVRFLAYCQQPPIINIFSDLTASANLACQLLNCQLEENPHQFTYLSLSDSAREQFSIGLINYCLENGMEEESVKQLIGPNYRIINSSSFSTIDDVGELSLLLNACGRTNQPDIALSLCKNDQSALIKAKQILSEYYQTIFESINFARHHCDDYGAFYLVDARGSIADYSIGSVIGAIIASKTLPLIKPIIGLSEDSAGMIKVSSRANKTLLELGINLDFAMRESSKLVGGVGGGHKVAAGATIAQGTQNEFLKSLASIIEKQSSTK